MIKIILGCINLTERTLFDFVKNNYKMICLVFVVLFLPFLVLFGITGLKTFAAIFFLFFLPFFFIVYSLSLDVDEKVFFSLFIGLVVFSQILWYIDRVIHNIYWSCLITGLLFYGVGIYLSVVRVRKRVINPIK